MHWIYVLRNRSNDELYYGYTNSLERRLKEHEVGNKCKFIYCEGYLSELDARERERKLKHYGQTRTHLKRDSKDRLSYKISAGFNSHSDLCSLSFHKSRAH